MKSKYKAISPVHKPIELLRKHYSVVSGIPIENCIYMNLEDSHVKTALRCAILSVDEIISLPMNEDLFGRFINVCSEDLGYWNNVKTELNKMLKYKNGKYKN